MVAMGICVVCDAPATELELPVRWDERRGVYCGGAEHPIPICTSRAVEARSSRCGGPSGTERRSREADTCKFVRTTIIAIV